MKLIRPPDSSTAHFTFSSESICWSRASPAISSGVIRFLAQVPLDHLSVLDEDQRLRLEQGPYIPLGTVTVAGQGQELRRVGHRQGFAGGLGTPSPPPLD
jgi:hypothetical protein